MSFIGKIFSGSAAQRLSGSAALASVAFVLLTACSGGSSDPTAVAGDFTAYGVKGTVNGQNVTLDLIGLCNCATNIENMVIDINANGASISPEPRIARDYSQPVLFTLTAPDGTKVVYTVTVKGAACVTAPPPPPSTPDTTPPVITVLGTNPLSLTVGTAYTEAGATCIDNKDPSCTVVTTGTVNTAVVGAYTITYTATDAVGNVSSMTRTVNVVAAADPAPVSAPIGILNPSDHGGAPLTTPIILATPSDIQNRVVTCIASGLPAGLILSNDGTKITGSYDAGQVGPTTVNFTRTCDAGATGNTLVQNGTIEFTDEDAS